jgi:HSP20 family protein
MAEPTTELAFPTRLFPRRFFEWSDMDRWFPGGVFAPFSEDVLRVDEFHTDGELVIRVEMPGVDPDKDVDIRVIEGSLHIRAEKRKEKRVEQRDVYRSEIHYGAFSRVLPLPPGTTEKNIRADYTNGVLEIHVPVKKEAPTEGKKITVTHA